MKPKTLFELGYLDLIKALFFGKKIELVPDKRVRPGHGTALHGEAIHHVDPDDVHGTGWTFGVPGHRPYYRPDLFNFWD